MISSIVDPVPAPASLPMYPQLTLHPPNLGQPRLLTVLPRYNIIHITAWHGDTGWELYNTDTSFIQQFVFHVNLETFPFRTYLL